MKYRPIRFAKNISDKISFIKNYLVSQFAEYGLVHLAIQIGPYLFDWLNNSELRIRSVSSTSAMLFLYPSQNSVINPIIHKNIISDFIFNFRKKLYSMAAPDNHCQTFVNEFLGQLNIVRDWKRIGEQPIGDFLKEVKDGKIFFQ